MEKVFITGLGFISSIGNGAKEVTDSLLSLRHGIEVVPEFQRPEVPVKVAGTIKHFSTTAADCEDWIWPKEYAPRREILRSMPPHGLYAWCAMQQAIADAQLLPIDYQNQSTGIYCASAGSPRLLHGYMTMLEKHGVSRCPPTGIVASIAGTLNFNLVSAFKIQGHSCGFSSACASSGHALGYAWDDIALGRQKRIFIVGAEDGNFESIVPFAGMRALSLQSDPVRASCPFDRDRDGFVGTGGATVIVLESEAEVKRRDIAPYAEFVSWAQASDGHNVAISHPEGRGLEAAMQEVMRRGNIKVSSIDYINAHATSTPIGDLSEALALKSVFGEELKRIPVSSTKALTGHGLSMASSLEIGICALSIRFGFTPGQAHLRNIDQACSFLNLPTKTLSTSANVVMKNSSGFGGANVSIILKSPKTDH